MISLFTSWKCFMNRTLIWLGLLGRRIPPDLKARLIIELLAIWLKERPSKATIRLLHKFPPFFKHFFSKNFNNQNNNTSINYVLSFIVYYFFPSFHQFVDSISPEILRSSLEEVVEPILKMILIFEAKTPHFIWKAAEEMVIRRGEVWGIGRMLKDLPPSSWSAILTVFAVCGRALSWRRITWPCRFGLFCRIASLTQCNWALKRFFSTVRFFPSISQWIKPSQSHHTQIIVFIGCRSFLILGLGFSPGLTHSFLCFIFT